MLYTKPNEQEKTKLLSHTKYLKPLLLSLILITITGCARYGNPLGTITADYTDLPVQTLQEAALYIETQAQEGNRTPDLSPHDTFLLDAPGTQQVLRSRAARSVLVKDLINSGHMYEKRNGKISIIRSKAYKQSGTPQTRDRDALIVISENNDRQALYEALQELNNLDPAARSAIAETFFNARVQLMQYGQLYEASGGEVTQKQ